MTLFNTRKRLARETAQQMISGHTTLLALWAVHNAGVTEAMRKDGPVEPREYAERTNMSGETLEALLGYLTERGVVERVEEGKFALTQVGLGLIEYEAGVIEQMRAYQPVMQMLEHHLAKLRVAGAMRKTDAAVVGQVRRYRGEVYPAVAKAVVKAGATHVLDLACDTGDLLVHVAEASKQIAGVGVSNDGTLVRQANDLIAKHNLEKRLIAIPAGALEVCLETRETFSRTGITAHLWEKFDCLLACNVFSELLAQNRERATAALRQIPLAFPGATLVLAEPCAGEKFDRNYYAPEMDLMLRLSRTQLLTAGQWREVLGAAGLGVTGEASLTTDGVVVFVCKPRGKA